MRRVEIEEYKHIVLSILSKVDRICRENNITYSLAYGTLLGAIRHNGFIPWDDDADIVIYREEYIKLREIINQGDYGIRFIDITTEKSTIYPFGKICDVHTHLKEKNFRQVKDYGAFVDVFPLDFLPNDEKTRKRICKKHRRRMILLTHSVRTGYEKSSSRVTTIKRCVAYHSCRFVNSRKLIERMERDFLKMDENQTNYVGIPWAWNGYTFESSVFRNLVDHSFENLKLYIPKDYDYVLRWRYGDYMTLPPEDERVNLHQLECYIDEVSEK